MFSRIQTLRAAREAAGATEPAWEGAGSEVGMLIWRVEQFQVKPWDPTDHIFYAGDAYIILHTYRKENALKWDIFFWLGRDCSQDEAGTAAYKSVELDDVLKGAAVQHREVMGQESVKFLSLFDPCLKTVERGIESGFRHVSTSGIPYEAKLLRVVQEKSGGEKMVIVREVPMVNSALNQGDVFILDKGLELFQWQGSDCGIFEKYKASTIVRALDSERGGKCKVIVLEGYDENPEFHSQLEGSAVDIKTKEEGEKD
ncbi:hypothetical protein CYMTET_23346 [Cymbomonas tetramitiformis]|uniref:Gelsolin-like domain-containing protein n=1 Tax=Cymbomonas tetramitiformis TaxID=36881 RepID=A0AAE0FYC9_9CHLO|nr:hypothetical protein CYMTET_23346 [Cymbomonas tetramitiformis]